MRRFLTLVCLLCLAIPAGISISGCYRNPDANYCNGRGFGLKVDDVATILMQPQTFGISLAYGQTEQTQAPSALTCMGTAARVSRYFYGTTNNQLVDISPSGNICAGTWNRNTGGGIADYTICNYPNPLPSTGSLPYGIAYITASANSISSNPVEVYVHAQVTSVSLVGPTTCKSQGTVALLDSQACFDGGDNKQYLLCAPPSVTTSASPNLACNLPYVNGVSGAKVPLASIPDCSTAIGNLNYSVGTPAIASLNVETNQITAEQPGTTVILASIAGGSSSAGYFSTCPPASINVTLANGSTAGTVTQGVNQNLTTTITDTNGATITGLTLDYQSTNPINISSSGGSITTSFPGEASVYAVCQPPTCNPTPINLFGLFGTGLSISSNPVTITTPGTASDYLWFGAPGQSQYIVPVELLSGTVGSTARLPYVPNSMVMDQLGANIYFGSLHELMIYSTVGNTISKEDPSVPGVVLAVSPNAKQLLINDQLRQVFYIYSVTGGISSAFGGVGSAAAWTPDSKTLYITDSAALNNSPENVAAGINGHTDTMYVYNVNTGWTKYPLACSVYNATSCPNPSAGAQNLALTIPSVGAFLSGSPTVAHTWCPTGTVGNSASILFYPQTAPPDIPVAATTDVLAATDDGSHILGASLSGNNITLSDIGITIPSYSCLPPAADNNPLAIGDSFSQAVITTELNQPPSIAADASAVNQVVTGLIPQTASSQAPAQNLAFITYNPASTTTNDSLPYYLPGSYVPGTGFTAGTVGSVTLGGSSASEITAPIAGAFSPDDTLFFVSTAGDNMIHYISVPLVTSNPAKADTQQISPNLPACTPGSDPNCIFTNSTLPASGIVPATVIVVKPRSTT
jgi:hypothetical protein